MTFAAGVRRRLQQLGPYKSLGILLIPLILVEPAKMAGVAFMGLGHWVGGACLIVGAYAAGLLVVDRLFRVVKSKLYTIRWCATLAGKFQSRLAWWRRRLLGTAPAADPVVIPQIEAMEANSFALMGEPIFGHVKDDDDSLRAPVAGNRAAELERHGTIEHFASIAPLTSG